MESLLYVKDAVLSSELCDKYVERHQSDYKNEPMLKYKYSNVDRPLIHAIKSGIDDYIQQCFYHVSNDPGEKDIMTDFYKIQLIPQSSSITYEPPSISEKNNCFSFVFYLNTVDQACDKFIDNTEIEAVQGRLVVFPCDWTFPCKHGSSRNKDKYVLKGTVFFTK